MRNIEMVILTNKAENLLNEIKAMNKFVQDKNEKQLDDFFNSDDVKQKNEIISQMTFTEIKGHQLTECEKECNDIVERLKYIRDLKDRLMGGIQN